MFMNHHYEIEILSEESRTLLDTYRGRATANGLAQPEPGGRPHREPL